MKATFEIVTATTGTRHYTVKIEETDLKLLENFTDHQWTSQRADVVIKGVQNAKSSGERYQWANEDIHLLATKERVFFFDTLAGRAGLAKTKQDLDLSHDDFIAFMTDFKKFIEENS